MKWLFPPALLLAMNSTALAQIDAVKNITTEPLSQYVVTPNNLKANTGRLLLNFPTQTVWTIYVYKMSDGKYVTSYAHTNAPKSLNIAPGKYKITLNNAPLANVSIEKGHDTRLKVGVLKIEVNDVWYLYDEAGTIYCSSGNKPATLIMPVGKYLLKVDDIDKVVIVDEGTRKELSGERPIINKEQYIMVPVEGQGKLTIPKHQPFAFPIQVPIYIYPPGNTENEVFKCGYNIGAANPANQCPVNYPIPEGFYDIYYAGVPFPYVEVRKGYETRLKLGYLKHTGQDLYGIMSDDSDKRHLWYSSQSETLLPWPPGKYRIKAFFINDNFREVEVTDGQTATVNPLIPPTYVGNLVITTPIAGHFPAGNKGRIYNSAASTTTMANDTSSNLLMVKYPNTTAYLYIRAHKSRDLSPGMYTVFLNGVDVKVQVDSKHESKLRVGYLNMLQFDVGSWEVHHATENRKYTIKNGLKTIALPVGLYRIKINNQYYLIKIKDDETLKFAQHPSFVPQEWEED